jgi:hypothetical protein
VTEKTDTEMTVARPGREGFLVGPDTPLSRLLAANLFEWQSHCATADHVRYTQNSNHTLPSRGPGMVPLFNLRFLNLRFHYQFVLHEGSWPRNTARAAGLPASAARRSHNCWISVNQLGV